MKKKNTLAKKMMIALVLGLICGIGCIFLRENLIQNGQSDLWSSINSWLFADISAEGNEQALGIFYIVGQLFVRALQVIIIPMVFTSITLAMIKINDARKLGRISSKTIGTFLLTSVVALAIASIVGIIAFDAGVFGSFDATGLEAGNGSTGSNPLMILINAIPLNIVNAFSNNSGVLAVVILAVATGLAINALKGKIEILPKLCEEISSIVTVSLGYIVNTFGPIAIFALITRTFASYGIDFLKPAMMYVIITTVLLLLYLTFGYAFFVSILAKINPIPFIKKISKVALFGFSTSSSAATLPLNLKTTTEEIGVHEEIASFVLPLGMTINMDGTAIMQVIATIFVASCGGYEITLPSVILIAILALVASIGTPAAPGAGAIVLFTILSGTGFTNEMAMMAYTLILAINRPIEMLVTSLNCIGDSAAAVIVSKSEGMFDEEVYNSDACNSTEEIKANA